jgi:hypothetical protein
MIRLWRQLRFRVQHWLLVKQPKQVGPDKKLSCNAGLPEICWIFSFV